MFEENDIFLKTLKYLIPVTIILTMFTVCGFGVQIMISEYGYITLLIVIAHSFPIILGIWMYCTIFLRNINPKFVLIPDILCFLDILGAAITELVSVIDLIKDDLFSWDFYADGLLGLHIMLLISTAIMVLHLIFSLKSIKLSRALTLSALFVFTIISNITSAIFTSGAMSDTDFLAFDMSYISVFSSLIICVFFMTLYYFFADAKIIRNKLYNVENENDYTISKSYEQMRKTPTNVYQHTHNNMHDGENRHSNSMNSNSMPIQNSVHNQNSMPINNSAPRPVRNPVPTTHIPKEVPNNQPPSMKTTDNRLSRFLQEKEE